VPARLNETLEELNRRFLASPDGARYRDRDWIRLSELVGDRGRGYSRSRSFRMVIGAEPS
jgi:hypothetical protein